MDLAVVIVNWNVRDLLRGCLESVRRGLDNAGLDAAVVVVDNASTDGSAAMLRRDFPWVRLIAAPRNVGFTAGNNLALRLFWPSRRTQPPLLSGEAAGATTDDQRPTTEVYVGGRWSVVGRPGRDPLKDRPGVPRYVLLLNPDTEIVGDALGAMVAYMDAHPDVGLLGPRLRYPDGSVQPSRRRFPTLQTLFLESTLLQQWWPHSAALRRFYVQDQPDDVTQDVDWIVGAAMLARSEALQPVGLLDEGYFMYSEEVDWARRFGAAGWRVVYLPGAEVIHYEGKSSEQVVAQRAIYFQSSKVRYARKWHGAVVAEGLRLFLLTTYLVQMGEEGAKWLVGHRRPLRAARMAAYCRVLLSGLRG